MSSPQLKKKKKSSFYHYENPSVTIKQNTDQDALVLQECRRDVCILEGGQLQLRFCCPVCFLPWSFHWPLLNCVLKLWFLLCQSSFSKNIPSTKPMEKEFHKEKKLLRRDNRTSITIPIQFYTSLTKYWMTLGIQS